MWVLKLAQKDELYAFHEDQSQVPNGSQGTTKIMSNCQVRRNSLVPGDPNTIPKIDSTATIPLLTKEKILEIICLSISLMHSHC